MARHDYRPGRRRKPLVSLLLDWAAGVVSLVVDPGLERLGALVAMSFVAWPLGASLGVWLCVGRPLSARGLGYALALTLAGAALLMLPYWLDVESDLLRGIGGISALLAAPMLARAGVGLARGQGARVP